MPSENCIFCQIAAGKVPADIYFQDEGVLAFRDIHPVAPTHLLIIPRRHIATANEFSEADSALIGRLPVTAAQIARELRVEQSGYRLVMNCNRDAGQTVFHVHLHLLAGRRFNWPPG
jgi:histidine triad (HIT) family protein